jgi:PAS domain S-box-containing protein
MPGAIPPVPPDEHQRLQELLHYCILDTEPEANFDDITQIAALVCNTPVAIITLVDAARQWFKSKIGISTAESPREIAFCAYTITQRDLFVVKDAHADPRFRDNPLVTSDPHIRFYAGAPLITARGHALGTLAVIDRVPRDISADQRRTLIALSKQVVAQLEVRRWAAEGLDAFRAIVRACPLAIIALDMQGRVLIWNESAHQMFGWTEAEVLGRPTPIVPPEDADSFQQIAASARENRILRSQETRRVRKDGNVIDVTISSAPLSNRHGEVIGVVGILDDVTDRKRQRNELENSVSLLRATLDATADGIMAVDTQGQIVSFNRRLAELWNIPATVLESGDVNAIIEFAMNQLRDPEHFMEKIRRYFAGEAISDFDTLQFKDGRLLERYAHPQYVNGVLAGRVFSYRDITRRTQLEEQLRQAQKMEAIGQLAGGIAHDFNNLLNVIVGYTALLQAKLAEDNLRGHADQIMKAADRAAALTRQLLVFSRKQVLETKVLDVNALVVSLSKMLPRLIGEDVELVIDVNADVGYVRADPGQIEQVIMNLVINARDAMPGGGHLTIGTDNLTIDKESKAEGATSGDYVVLRVSDDGNGMTEDVKAHIFEPFFTTKQPGKGTGLGLATVYAIVRQSGGVVEVQSEAGKGSTFRVYLPRVAETADTAQKQLVSDSSLSGTETILVVEDETSLRDLMRHILQRRGYTVLDAHDGMEAIRRAQHFSHPIDLVITDVVMPGLRGWEAAEQIRTTRPDIKVLYISGYNDDLVVNRHLIGEHADFLQKPFTPDALVRKVREVLSAESSRSSKK